MLKTVSERFSALGMSLVVPEAVVDELSRRGYDERYGARPLRRTIQTLIEDSAADLLLDGSIGSGDTVSAELVDEKIVLTKMAG